jgi:hypothetical protein
MRTMEPAIDEFVPACDAINISRAIDRFKT